MVEGGDIAGADAVEPVTWYAYGTHIYSEFGLGEANFHWRLVRFGRTKCPPQG